MQHAQVKAYALAWICSQAAQGDQAQQGMLELVMDELLRDADAGLDLALRWLSALAITHCRPRLRSGSDATDAPAAASRRQADGDTDMRDADAAGPATKAAPAASGLNTPLQQASDVTADAAADIEAAQKAGSAEDAGRVGAAGGEAAAAGEQHAGLASSPYETALLAMLRACRCCAEPFVSCKAGHTVPPHESEFQGLCASAAMTAVESQHSVTRPSPH